MRVQEIASLERRLASYRRMRFSFYTREGPIIVSLTAVVISICMYLIDRYSPAGYPNWEWVSVILAVCISAPALLCMKPKRPTQEDVYADQNLRRIHSLNDSVEK